MLIELYHLLPEPLAGITDPNTQIWKQSVRFEMPKKYQLNAPSGRGKSTFIHIVYGLRQDFTGKLYINQQEVRTIQRAQWAKLRQSKISIVFQSLRLLPELTAWQNLQVKQLLLPRQDEKQIREMILALGVEHLLDKKVATLSYGERQRFAIIRALIQPFELLLLDEPFSHLDEVNIQIACELITQKCKENNAGLIMTSLGYPYYLTFDERLNL
ncbi:MAG: ATP-binding cassette domain-containing protein [Microscillaceae bacterium]|nr:ATP-binding cassette domain-containing protein [Microscillaceae bacterium]MDW8461486.1 ATP-binding cassette domain-containing protein [Cytophagales bacterium]